MRKIKIFLTLLALYEFVMVMILQIHGYCVAIFNNNFCEIDGFKYFLMCVMLPVSFGLFLWWIPEMTRLICPNKCCVRKEETPQLKNVFNEIISKQDIEKFITTAIIMGIQKFAASHPKTEETFENIMNILHNTKVKKKKTK